MDWPSQLKRGAPALAHCCLFARALHQANWIRKSRDLFLAETSSIDPSRIYHQACGLGLMIVGVLVRLIYHTSFIGG